MSELSTICWSRMSCIFTWVVCLVPVDWIAHLFHGFRLTQGWGTLATILLAAVAIIVSILSLRRNAAQFQQQRRDDRTDKLRAEIASLAGALHEQKRLRDIMSPIADPGIIDAEVKAREVADRFEKSLSGAEVQASYHRAMAHTYAIQMLTDDETILRLAHNIGTYIALDVS